MIREGEMSAGFEFLFPRAGEKKKTENAVYEDDNIPDIPCMDTESIPLHRDIGNGKPVQKK
jgi:hypothetical protein